MMMDEKERVDKKSKSDLVRALQCTDFICKNKKKEPQIYHNGKLSNYRASCKSHLLRHSGEPRIGSGAGAGIQNCSKIVDSGSRFACLE